MVEQVTPPPIAAQIIHALRDGCGVEDIAAKGIATVDEARAVVARLRRLGFLRQVYSKPKRARA